MKIVYSIYYFKMWNGELVSYNEILKYSHTIKFLNRDMPDYIIDELKPLFGITKTGMCLVEINSKKKVCTLEQNYTFLKDFKEELSHQDVKKIRRIFIFRIIFGISPNTERSIGIINFNGNLDFISVNEKYIDISDECKISKKVFDKYFESEKVFFDEIKDIFNDMSIDFIREEIINTIKRIDKIQIEFASLWTRRIQTYMEISE